MKWCVTCAGICPDMIFLNELQADSSCFSDWKATRSRKWHRGPPVSLRDPLQAPGWLCYPTRCNATLHSRETEDLVGSCRCQWTASVPPVVQVAQRERWFRTRAGVVSRFPPDFSEHLTQWMSENVSCVWVNGAWKAQLSPCSGSEFCNKYTRQQRTKSPWEAQRKSWASGN